MSTLAHFSILKVKRYSPKIQDEKLKAKKTFLFPSLLNPDLSSITYHPFSKLILPNEARIVT